MTSKKIAMIAGAALIVAALIALAFVLKGKQGPAEATEITHAHRGTIKNFVSTTGTISPKNRLEIKPPIDGRVERIIVKEGDRVRIGQTLLWMSSTERAALIDAARAQGDREIKYWQEVYKPIPLVAPITGTVIVRSLEPGQTVTKTTPILVLSDYLIVKASVDETDIGRIRQGQRAEIGLDAYPEVRATGRVIHIKFESTTVNNVTTYEVEIRPDRVPAVFKSGMTANINIFDQVKANALLLPIEAVVYENSHTYVLIKRERTDKAEKRAVRTGISDEQYVEIVSGISEKEPVIIKKTKFATSEKAATTNPFMPKRRPQSGK